MPRGVALADRLAESSQLRRSEAGPFHQRSQGTFALRQGLTAAGRYAGPWGPTARAYASGSPCRVRRYDLKLPLRAVGRRLRAARQVVAHMAAPSIGEAVTGVWKGLRKFALFPRFFPQVPGSTDFRPGRAS
jgi:hypothetical protein